MLQKYLLKLEYAAFCLFACLIVVCVLCSFRDCINLYSYPFCACDLVSWLTWDFKLGWLKKTLVGVLLHALDTAEQRVENTFTGYLYIGIFCNPEARVNISYPITIPFLWPPSFSLWLPLILYLSYLSNPMDCLTQCHCRNDDMGMAAL